MLKKTIKVLLVTIAVFGVLEIAARIHYRGRFPYHLIFDEALLWRHRPNWSGEHRGDVQCAFNGIGLRESREIASPKPAGVRRALLVGDSIAFGYALEHEQTIARRLETTWNAADAATPRPPIEVINAGVCGFATEQQTIFLEEVAPKVEPDIVALLICMNNDIDIESLDEHRTRRDATNPGQRDGAAAGGVIRFLVEHSAIAFGAARYIERRRTKSGELRRNHEGNALRFTKLEDLVRLDDAAKRKVYARLEARLVAFKSVVDRAGAKAVLAVCPEETQVSGKVSAAPIATIDQIARRLGFETIDLLGAYRGAEHPVLMEDGTHPSAAGAELIATVLKGVFTRLLPVAPHP